MARGPACSLSGDIQAIDLRLPATPTWPPTKASWPELDQAGGRRLALRRNSPLDGTRSCAEVERSARAGRLQPPARRGKPALRDAWSGARREQGPAVEHWITLGSTRRRTRSDPAEDVASWRRPARIEREAVAARRPRCSHERGVPLA
jgi:hypothetical protein